MSRTSNPRRRTAPPSHAPATPDRLPVVIALQDLAVAPENLRAEEAPDAAIDELAETLAAAGLLQPLTVRPGLEGEKPAMVLDGRRRLLALETLQAQGRVAADHPVSCFVETEPTRQGAAAVLTNTAVPVHLADVIVAIGRMLKAGLSLPAIAGALGYGELDVRRLAALAELHPQALAALKSGRCSLRQAKLLARLGDRELQAEVAEAALNGFGFQEWRVSERLDAGQVTVRDRRFPLVGPAGYAAGGGRIEADLFGERADVILDPDRLQAAWTARAEAIGRALTEDRDWRLVISADEPELELDDGALEPFGCAYGMGLDAEALQAWRRATDAAEAARQALRDCDLAQADPEILAFLRARIAADLAGEPPRAVRVLALFADTVSGLDVRLWGPAALPADGDAPPDVSPGAPRAPLAGASPGERPDRAGPRPEAAPTPVAAAPPVDVSGSNHALHELRTDVATRVLVRALADDPAAALVAVVARLFSLLVLRQGRGRGEGALSLDAEAYSRPGALPIPALDGDVRRRLAERREACAASGLSPIAWVAGLAEADRLGLLAELAGLSLDLREARTSALRHAARAEAAEIAALCQADITRHWTPDAAFLSVHPKAKLLAMLEEMGAGDPGVAGARKDELVALVAARAAERTWAPACLSWAPERPPPTGGDDRVADEPVDMAAGVTSTPET